MVKGNKRPKIINLKKWSCKINSTMQNFCQSFQLNCKAKGDGRHESLRLASNSLMSWALFKYSPHRHNPLLESCIIYWAVLEQCNAMWNPVTRIHIWSSYQLNACHCRFHKFRAPELPAIIFFSSTAFTQDTDKAREWQGKGFGKKYRISWKPIQLSLCTCIIYCC